MGTRRTWLAAASALALVGCSAKGMVEKLAPKEEVAFARSYLDHLRKGELEAIQQYSGAALQVPDAPAKLAELARLFPGEPSSVELVGARIIDGPAAWHGALTFQYGFEQRWLLAALVLQRKDGHLTVEGLTVTPMRDSLQRIHAFTLEGKGPTHFLFAGVALAILAFTLATFVVCLRTRGLRKKALWALLVLVGVSAFQLDWTSGRLGFQPISIHLLGVGASRFEYGPWILSFSLPVGAVIFLVKRARLRRQADAEPPAPGASPPAP